MLTRGLECKTFWKSMDKVHFGLNTGLTLKKIELRN